jgi:DNA-binding CsgD family transcriptional regulator
MSSPPALLPVAGRARAVAAGASSSNIGLASARILTKSGRWLHAHATLRKGQLPLRAALILEATRPAELAPLIVEAYGFSHRERQITELVLQGASTAEMASRLSLSPLTVQDHLKSIFEKMSVRSRREVASRIFFDHHFPPTMQMDPSGSWQFVTDPAERRFGRRDSG